MAHELKLLVGNTPTIGREHEVDLAAEKAVFLERELGLIVVELVSDHHRCKIPEKRSPRQPRMALASASSIVGCSNSKPRAASFFGETR